MKQQPLDQWLVRSKQHANVKLPEVLLLGPATQAEGQEQPFLEAEEAVTLVSPQEDAEQVPLVALQRDSYPKTASPKTLAQALIFPL